MSVNYYSLLWQKLNEHFGDGTTTTFVMAVGQQLLHTDFHVKTGKKAAYNTFELLDETIACGTNKISAGSRISLKWKQLLEEGKGPSAGPQQQDAFENAKRALFKNYQNKVRSELYEDYIKKRNAYLSKKVDMEFECQDKYNERWQVYFDKKFPVTQEYLDYQDAHRVVGPLLKAIDEWDYGPLAGVLRPIKEGIAIAS